MACQRIHAHNVYVMSLCGSERRTAGRKDVGGWWRRHVHGAAMVRLHDARGGMVCGNAAVDGMEIGVESVGVEQQSVRYGHLKKPVAGGAIVSLDGGTRDGCVGWGGVGFFYVLYVAMGGVECCALSLVMMIVVVVVVVVITRVFLSYIRGRCSTCAVDFFRGKKRPYR